MANANAKLRYLRVAPRKVRFVADLIRRLPVSEAEAELSLHPRKPAVHLLKLLRSAKANAVQKHMDVKTLFISEIRVDEGPKLKRYNPRARGSMAEIQKKMSHVSITLGDGGKSGRDFVMPKKEKKAEKKKKENRKKPGKDAQKEAPEKEVKPKPNTEKGTKRFFRRKSV